MSQAVLVAIPPSGYVEKARWALLLAKVPFVEENHVPIFHRRSTKPKGGQTVPLLYYPEQRTALTDSSYIVALAAKKLPSLHPSDEAKQLEAHFDNDFGPHARRCAVMMHHHDSATGKLLITTGVDSKMERRLGKLMYPVLKFGLFKFINVKPEAVEESWAQVQRIVAEVDSRLGDTPIGNRFLCGDEISAADISFCAHMSQLVMPPEHVFFGPIFDLIDVQRTNPMRDRVRQLRASRSLPANSISSCALNGSPPELTAADFEVGRADADPNPTRRSMSKPILVSLPPSGYVEKARWALQLAKIEFIEERHVPVFHRRSTKPKGGQSVPLLYFPEQRTALTDSTDIVALAAKTLPSLYPSDEAKQLESHFDNDLGPHARRCATMMAQHDKATGKSVFTTAVDSSVERFFGNLLYPIIRSLLFKVMNVTPKTAEESWEEVQRVVAEVDSCLGDAPVGSRFLCGDKISAADLAFCSHMSQLVLPPEHVYLGYLFDRINSQPTNPFRERVIELRASRVGQFVLWCYEHARPSMVMATAQA
ncbi:TPA: LOW QUALITY PROTEIN: hypothetical protein N0F65_001344 [Lagenidium giganteum]|uniref:GST N-terminal domain-containing protein n=1 Tax=Lagenidium giganteum TaxID=4803 RepID=A0AAV2YXZ6_9STRA|nr:TPA: LOW QUALITY PROTEIN: hypothetical protein N0F65_001344 [Lagenidium giganteum]